MSGGGRLVLAATDGAGTIGGGGFWRYFQTDAPGYGFVAEDVPEVGIGLVPGWRGMGIGTRLMRALQDEAVTRGIPRLSLSVDHENPAQRLYERVGFKVVGGYDDEIVMVAETNAPRDD